MQYIHIIMYYIIIAMIVLLTNVAVYYTVNSAQLDRAIQGLPIFICGWV